MPRRRQRCKLSPKDCVFCASDVNDEFLYGKFHHLNGLSVHQNCMFFSSGLKQDGKKDSDGILGFKMSDIKAEILRGKRLRCFYCKSAGATIGCCDYKCRRTFHFPCGIKYLSLNQHFGAFKSYCVMHKPKQSSMITPKEEYYCRICFLSLEGETPDTCLHSPCCKDNWFHRTCLQQYALNAGRYFFKCPLCNNNSAFLEEMLLHGIFIPDQDASWELAENAFQDLLYRPECGAVSCDCKKGRKYSGKREWTLLPCSTCGSQARHKFCEKLLSSDKSWKCNECKGFENKIIGSKHLEGISREKQDIQQPNPRSRLLFLGSPSKSNSSSSPNCSSLKSITNTLNRTVKSPVVSNSVSSEIEISLTKAASEFSVKRKSEDELQPSTNFKELTVPTPLGSISTMKRMKGTQQTTLKVETSETSFVPNIVICAPAKLTKVSLSHWAKKKNKTPNTPCCSSSNQCIRKMFGLECHNYRI